MAITPETQKNNPANVSLGKTNVTGYAYWAPKVPIDHQNQLHRKRRSIMAITPETQKNNPANVSLGKTNVTGYAYWAPKGTALPSDASTALAATYVGLGYIGEDGITNASDSETTDVKEMGGENVLSIITSYSETYQFVLIEAMRKSAAQIRYGEQNVTGEDGALSITHTMPDDTEFVLVVELALTGGKKDRFVIPRAVRKESARTAHSPSRIRCPTTPSSCSSWSSP